MSPDQKAEVAGMVAENQWRMARGALEESLRTIVLAVTQELRQELADHNISGFTFIIQAKGRTSSGDAKLEFSLAPCQYNVESVKVGTLPSHALAELLRRKGFAEAHAPVCLPAPGLSVEPDEAPDDLPF